MDSVQNMLAKQFTCTQKEKHWILSWLKKRKNQKSQNYCQHFLLSSPFTDTLLDAHNLLPQILLLPEFRNGKKQRCSLLAAGARGKEQAEAAGCRGVAPLWHAAGSGEWGMWRAVRSGFSHRVTPTPRAAGSWGASCHISACRHRASRDQVRGLSRKGVDFQKRKLMF